MQEFTTKAAEDDERPWVDFGLDGHTMHARRPKTAVLLDLAASSTGSTLEQVAAVRDFIDACFDQDSLDHLNGRMYDPDDDFDLDGLTPVIEWLQGQFLRPSRPTTPSSASSPTRRPTGRGSTARARSQGSTPSPSTPPA